MPGPVAVLDANVLYPAGSRDFFMRVHLEGIYQPKWTAAIHEEWMRAVSLNEGISRAKLERVRWLMDRHAGNALVRGWQTYLPRVAATNIDPKDHHVVAAALKAQKEAGEDAYVLIITSNVRHFPMSDLHALGLSRMRPDAFALDLFRNNRDKVLEALRKMRAALKHPPFSRDAFVDQVLAKHFPSLAEAIAPLQSKHLARNQSQPRTGSGELLPNALSYLRVVQYLLAVGAAHRNVSFKRADRDVNET